VLKNPKLAVEFFNASSLPRLFQNLFRLSCLKLNIYERRALVFRAPSLFI
jgi:hypothetical protein